MTHCIQGFIADAKKLSEAAPGTAVCLLKNHNLGFLPWVDDTGIQSIAYFQKFDFPVAYISTDYFGGAGEQKAAVYVKGKLVELNYGDYQPINVALAFLGVKKEGDKDEFDTVGLGKYRTDDDWVDLAPRYEPSILSQGIPTIGWSSFAANRHKKGAGFSYFTISPQAVLERIKSNWDKRQPGTGETGIDRKVLVPVEATGFFTSNVALRDGLPLKADVVRRQPGEDPYVEVYISGEDAIRLGIEPEPAKFCKIVCYSAEALLENNGERTTADDWEIVAVLASNNEQDHMEPLTMARNFLEKAGGTKTAYTAQEFAEAIYAHATNRGVKIK